MDGVVLAYRVFPRLLRAAGGDHRSQVVTEASLVRSRDFAIAKRTGIEIRAMGDDQPLSVLTAREQEVLGLILEGMSNAEIAGRLFITISTAKVHVRHILEKLGVNSRLQAALRAQELLAAAADSTDLKPTTRR
jgi:ATP/maltotriose-dependent transcriptional regulator MalT